MIRVAKMNDETSEFLADYIGKGLDQIAEIKIDVNKIKKDIYQ